VKVVEADFPSGFTTLIATAVPGGNRLASVLPVSSRLVLLTRCVAGHAAASLPM
jgi:hypothetical protein